MPRCTKMVRSVPAESAASSSAAVVTTTERDAVDSRGSGRELSEPDSGVMSAIAAQESRTGQTAKRGCDIESPVLGGPW